MKKNRKRWTAGLLGLALALGLAACGGQGETTPTPEPTPAAEEPAFQAGTHEVTKTGINEFTLAFTFSDTALTDIQVVKENETFGTGTVAIRKMAKQAIECQTAQPDAVSGATVTSFAFRSALQEAIKEAGGDPAAFRGEIPAEQWEDTSCDLVVVGAGNAGMVAAAKGAQAGLKVILLETTDLMGGTSMGAAYLVGGSTKVQKELGVECTQEDVTKWLLTRTGETSDDLFDPEWCRLFSQKATEVLALTLLLSGCSTAAADPTPAPTPEPPAETPAPVVETVFDPAGLADWMWEGGANGAETPAFLSGFENRPSKDEMCEMLELANTYFQCHSLTGTHFVVIQDEKEQEEILKLFVDGMGLDCSGTNMVLVMADGVKDQEHHQAQYFPGPTAMNGGNPEYWNMYYGIYEAGWASGYLNMVAASMGYRTRAYAAINIPQVETGEVNIGAGGDFRLITGENWDIEKYMGTKDGSEKFDHYVKVLDEIIPCEGNVTLLCAIIIGKVDESVDAVSGATKNDPIRMQNYDFWDWDDSYVSSVVNGVVTEPDGTTGATEGAEESAAPSAQP